MKTLVRCLAIYALVCLCLPARAAETFALSYKAQKGQVSRHSSQGSLTMEAGGNRVNIEAKEVQKITITDVKPDGTITMEQSTESEEVRFNGQTMPAGEPNKNVSTIIIRKDGTLVSFKMSEPGEDKTQARMFVATTPVFREQPVGVGDKWSVDYKADSDAGTRPGHADYEVLGTEKTGGTDTLKLKITYHETEGSPALTATSTVWVEKASGDTVVADTEIENLSMGMGGMTAQASGKMHDERISGSPIGGGKPAEPAKEKTIDDIVKDYTKVPGLFPLYRKTEAGRETVYLEIREDQLDKLMMMEVTASTGTASQIVAGDPINDIVFKFVKRPDNRVLMVTPNISFRAPEKTPMARAVRRSFADGYLEAFKIEATQPNRKSLLINVSDLFRSDVAQITAQLGGIFSLLGMPGAGGYVMDRDKTYVVSMKNFPDNLVVETAYHFTKGMGGGLAALMGGQTLPDPRSLPLNVIYNVFPLPDNGYKPRLADPRVGYFLTEYQDFGTDDKYDQQVRYIVRWDMEKADPRAALSPPKKAIVFWLDNAIPLEYRDAVRAGLLRWNKAFEKVGIKDAIVVKQMPDNADWDHADMRYNTIRWVTSPENGYAVALFRINPLTGQILNANITVDSNLVRFTKLERSHLVDPASYFEDAPAPTALSMDPRRCQFGAGAMEQAWFGQMALNMLAPPGSKAEEKAYINSFLSEVVSHEMGHIMGLRHNFIASTYHTLDELKDENTIKNTGISASVMDYNPFNIAALRQRGVDYFQPTIGPYDIWAIQYGYTPIDSRTPDGELYKLRDIASRCNEPGHAYQSDEIADMFDPAVVRFDLGKDPLGYWTRMLQTSRFMLMHLSERVPRKGESYWEFTRDFERLLGLYTRAAAVASRYVAGIHVNRNHKGDPGEQPTMAPVDAASQRRALDLLNTYVFAENAFSFPTGFYKKLIGDPFPSMDIMSLLAGGSSQEFNVRDQMASIQRAALMRLFSPAVLRRMSNNEFKTGSSGDELTLPVLFHSVRDAVWSELPERRNVSNLRRALQRAYLDSTIDMCLKPGLVTEDARMLAWDQLRTLKGRIAAAQSGWYDEYTRVHLDESLMRINRALDAKQIVSTPGTTQTSLLQLLMGGEQKQQAILP